MKQELLKNYTIQDSSPFLSVTSTSRYRTQIVLQTNLCGVDCWSECGNFLPLPSEAEVRNWVVVVHSGQKKSYSAAETSRCHSLQEWL